MYIILVYSNLNNSRFERNIVSVNLNLCEKRFYFMKNIKITISSHMYDIEYVIY